MLLHFMKMHGLGNDFVVIDLITQSARLSLPDIKRIANRNEGIGCDQVLLIEPPIVDSSHFYYRIFNANGEEVENCGNGARCVARFFYDRGFVSQNVFRADCLAGTLEFKIEENGEVTVNMGKPNFNPEMIPFKVDKELLSYPFTIADSTLSLSVLSLGNPHAILTINDLKGFNPTLLKKWGSYISHHALFPNQTNVGFMQVQDPFNIELTVYERGVGETKSCGSSACAAVVSGKRLGLLNQDHPIAVHFSTGTLVVDWQMDKEIYLTGPAKSVFIGKFRI